MSPLAGKQLLGRRRDPPLVNVAQEKSGMEEMRPEARRRILFWRL